MAVAANSFVPEIEQELLGALLEGASFPLAASVVEETHFLHLAHRRIWRACKTAHERSNTCKLTVVSGFLDHDAMAAELLSTGMKPRAYLAHLVSSVSFGAPRIVETARKVVEQWARLAVAEELETLSGAAKEPTADVKAIASRAGERLDEIMTDLRRGANRKSRFKVVESAHNAILAAQEARARGNGLTGISWGLTDLNRLTGGLQRGDLTLLAARPSMGKSTFAMGCAYRMARLGHGVGVISLEMGADKLSVRVMSDISFDTAQPIQYADIIRGNIQDRDLETLADVRDRLEGIPLYIEDQSGLRMNDIRVKLEALIQQAERESQKLEVLVVDHIGLIHPSARYNGNRVQEIAEISAGFKSMAREYGIAVLALSQLSRALEQRSDKRPQLSDLRDSGALEQDADTVIFLHREAYYLERSKGESPEKETERLGKLADIQNEIEVAIAKQRNGPIATVKFFASMAHSAIRGQVAA